MSDARPLCPRCGEPARTVVLRGASVECAIEPDGSPGDVLRVVRRGDPSAEYRCGGGHAWENEGEDRHVW